MKYKKLLLEKNFCRDAINRVSTAEHSAKRNYSLRDFIRQINLNSNKLKKIEALLHGNFRSSLAGTGFDFNEIREYRMGDDLRHISWNSTAKTGILQTKEYYAEKEIRTYLLIDISNSMFCGNKLEPFIKLTAFLLNLNCSFSEKIGSIFFSDDIKYHFPQAEPNLQANIIFNTLLDLINNPSSVSTSTNLAKTLEFLNRYASKKGLIFIVSDFINITNWEKQIYNASQKQNIYSFQVYDSIDYELPKSGYLSIIDPESKQRIFVNTDIKRIQETYKLLMNKKQEHLVKFLKSIGAYHFVIEKKDFS